MAKKYFDNMPAVDVAALKTSLEVAPENKEDATGLFYTKAEVAALIPVTVISDSGSYSHTGSTTETTVLTKTLPASKLGLFGAIEIISLASRSVFVNITDLAIYINDQKIMGATFAAGAKSISTHSFIQNLNSLTSQVGKALGSTGASFGSTSTVEVATTIDTSADMTLTVKIKHTEGTDSAALRGILIRLWK